MKFTSVFVGLLIVVILVVIVVSMGVSYSNAEIRLRNQISAQQNNMKVVFDNTWKVIKQEAKVTDKYKDAFAEIYPKLMDERYGNEGQGQLFSFIHESNPNFDASLYKKLMKTIEVQRTKFTYEQTKLIDFGREHENLLKTFPSSVFVGNREPIKLNIVTSTKTEEIFKDGIDDDVTL